MSSCPHTIKAWGCEERWTTKNDNKRENIKIKQGGGVISRSIKLINPIVYTLQWLHFEAKNFPYTQTSVLCFSFSSFLFTISTTLNIYTVLIQIVQFKDQVTETLHLYLKILIDIKRFPRSKKKKDIKRFLTLTLLVICVWCFQPWILAY